ncbi:MAG: membrane protein insertase YidC [Bacteroidales bacterium]|nr:membrane protein insertase YidC [Bacteroidales bacterium]
MDKNTVIGFLLIGVILFAFSWLNRPTPEQIEAQRRMQDSLQAVEILQQAKALKESDPTPAEEEHWVEAEDSLKNSRLVQRYGDFYKGAVGEEQFFVLENDLLEVTLSNKGGRVTSVRLKKYQTYDSLPLILFDGKESSFNFSLITQNNRIINTKNLYFEPVRTADNQMITFRLDAGEGRYLAYTYSLPSDSYMVGFDVKGNGLDEVLAPSTMGLDLEWNQVIRRQEKGRRFEERYSAIYYKFATDDVEQTSDSKDEDISLSNKVRWIGYKDQFFSSVLIANNEPLESVTLQQKISQQSGILKDCKTKAVLPFDIREGETASLQYYFGPNNYSLLKSYDEARADDNKLDLQRLVPLGGSVFRFVNTWLVIPVFNFFGKFISNYGIIILLLTLVVKLLLFPLTYKSYMSSAKMRVLRPQVEAINAKYPGQDKAMEKQKAIMELYSRAGASPMSGCLPMLLQMPVLIALFMFFPSSIELRQQSFLWAKDLSTYDAIVSWNTYIPLITPYFGNHISLFCLLMTITNIVYTKFNMDQTNTGQQQMPGMKLMMYLMPVMFLVFFNQYSAGLSYYYFVSTLITIIQTLIFRSVINEDKLLAKLEANKKKPVKKSGFMARLEEAQRRQMEAVKKQQQQQRKK